MANELIKKHLKELKSQKKFDADFIDILHRANEASEDEKSLPKSMAYEKQIDQLVYDLYGLNEDEIKIIEGQK